MTLAVDELVERGFLLRVQASQLIGELLGRTPRQPPSLRPDHHAHA